MAAALGDLIQITDFQTYLGQQVLNVYYYRIVNITGLADGYLGIFADWFKDVLLPPIVLIQNDGLLHVSRDLRNLSNGTDLYTDSEVIAGEQTPSPGQYSPSYLSLGFILRRESLATRNGYKRIAGLNEGYLSANDVTLDPNDISNIEDVLAGDITAGIISLAEPVIVKRPIDVPVGEYIYSSIGSASFRGLGTQNSRKPGRGV